MSIDILKMDSEIMAKFKEIEINLHSTQYHLSQIETLLCHNSIIPFAIKKKKQELNTIINELQEELNRKDFYMVRTVELLEKYKTILSQKQYRSFMKSTSISNPEKKEIEIEFLKIANEFGLISKCDVKSSTGIVSCKNCGNKKDFDINDGNMYICCSCSAAQVVLKNSSSYRDIDRINGSSRYSYLRSIHFRDTLNAFQAKNNTTIPDEIYTKLERELINHDLVNTEFIDKEKRYERITKDHVRIFLQEIGYKSYENINLIHFTLTGKKPEDISHLEDKLMHDFEILSDLYNRRCSEVDRKSFINTQYVLYQLLLKHKHKCNKEDFAVLKTIERREFHNDIMKKLTDELKWKFEPV
jgi:hypothetical protein